MKTSPTNLVSIVGAGHSGSTLLDLILGSNSSISSVGEITRWDEFLNENRECSCGKLPATCELWTNVVSKWLQYVNSELPQPTITDTRGPSINGKVNKFRHRLYLLLTLLLPVQKFPRVTKLLSPQNDRRAKNISKLFALIRDTTEKPIICDSSKSVSRFRLLHAQNPANAKAIFLTRDGRAVAASNLKRYGIEPTKSARDWRFVNLYTQLMLRTLPSGTYIHIRYEELCREPEKTLRKICDFIDCPFEAQMLEFDGARQHIIGGNRMRMKGLHQIQEDLKWRTTLSSTQLEAFNGIAGRTNSKLLGNFMHS